MSAPISSSQSPTTLTFTVFFEGTANELSSFTTQIGLFAELTNAIDLSGDVEVPFYDPSGQYKIAFDGCGVTNGMMGTIFATGLNKQCKEVESHIKKILSLQTSIFSSISSSKNPPISENDNTVVKLNVVGLSRGGIAAIQLAQILYYIPRERLQIHLLLFDPVPGNLIGSSRYLDIFGLNTANSALNLTYCQNLCDVLAIYPYEPLPDLAFHAPVLPQYPTECNVDEDATLGCHQGALFCSSRSLESRLSYYRIREWLEKHGTQLHDCKHRHECGCSATLCAAMDQATKLSMTPKECVALLDETMQPPNREVGSITRNTHSSPPGAVIILHSMSPSSTTRYLNKHHRQLSAKLSSKIDAKLKSSDEQQEEKDTEMLLEICRPSERNMFSSLSCTK